eukprot:761802-Hanusia_phi.AAC.4
MEQERSLEIVWAARRGRAGEDNQDVFHKHIPTVYSMESMRSCPYSPRLTLLSVQPSPAMICVLVASLPSSSFLSPPLPPTVFGWTWRPAASTLFPLALRSSSMTLFPSHSVADKADEGSQAAP